MSFSFLASTKNRFETLQRFIFPAENATEAADQLQKGEAQSSQYVKQSGKKRDFSSLPRDVQLSRTQWQHTHRIGKLFHFFEQIIALFERLWPNRPPSIDYRLFHNLTSSNATLCKSPSLTSETKAHLSEILSFSIDFLKKEKSKEKISSSLIQELIQCKKWSKKLESIQKSTDLRKQDAVTKEIANDIVTRVKKIKPGASLLIPGVG